MTNAHTGQRRRGRPFLRAAAGLVVAVERHRLAATLEGRPCRTVRALTTIAAVGASLYLAVTLGFLAADTVGLLPPTPLQGPVMVGALSLLVGIVRATLRIGGAGACSRCCSGWPRPSA